MKALEELQAELTQELLELQRLTGICPAPSKSAMSKSRRSVGSARLPEEDLSPLELNTLKRALGINGTRWRAFKAKFIEGSPPGELA